MRWQQRNASPSDLTYPSPPLKKITLPSCSTQVSNLPVPISVEIGIFPTYYLILEHIDHAALDGRECNYNVIQNQYYSEANTAKTAVARD